MGLSDVSEPNAGGGPRRPYAVSDQRSVQQ
ncbi:hypothetical protein SMD44_02805 [Streptomyces alboflavus]|uniref:Uncharacterized protein n=1 Tax=Streptomyces alboflavus TaxID=67267 RepID=A0A1Z1WAE0_9ACTN|nr:hypothetical protein SMD44_02805 [Streptomyces alboflavus]